MAGLFPPFVSLIVYHDQAPSEGYQSLASIPPICFWSGNPGDIQRERVGPGEGGHGASHEAGAAHRPG